MEQRNERKERDMEGGRRGVREGGRKVAREGERKTQKRKGRNMLGMH